MAATTAGRDGSRPADPRLVVAESPSCAECRRLAPVVERVSSGYPDVTVERFDVTADPQRARNLGVRATPTLIGYDGADETVRVTGGRSRAEMESLFDALRAGSPAASGPSGLDVRLRLLAGIALLGAGVAAGPSWILIGIGAVATVLGGAGALQRRRR
ncbi:MAG: thioredoxin family protein [Actinobacteria bacterium]|nr:thioredoxin family protein [Actinomycetota bacterium]